ncbi:hypothetical protein RJ639_043441 [Escallonia herrerae]|uniref:CCHC-type domain-containing protein n=1 Tax=Escallonia herrerae TaxID=1293975 RepID=A0AA88WIZ5_9ASTE|nr:hypothetical protein RJ639_043441 [Escallonia herrerae]
MKKDENSHKSKNESSMESTSRENKKKKGSRKKHSIKTSIEAIICSDNDSSGDEVGNTVIGGASVSTHAGSTNDNSELWYKWLGHLSEGVRIFGCPVYVHLQNDERSKIDPKSKECIFIGYEEGVKGYSYAHASDIWDVLNKKYVVEDAGTKRYAIGNFLQFQMSEETDVSSQIHESHLVVAKLTKEGMPLPEPFVTGSFIKKLPDSWSDYKSMMKHKRKDMTPEDVIVHITFVEKNRSHEKAAKAKEFTSKANLIEERHDRPHGNHNRQNNRFGRRPTHGQRPKPNHLKPQGSNFKKKGDCFVCGDSGHHAAQCSFRKGSDNRAPLRAHLAEAAYVIVAVVFEANIVTDEKAWVVDSGATRHICGNKSAFTSYTPVGAGEEQFEASSKTAASVEEEEAEEFGVNR